MTDVSEVAPDAFVPHILVVDDGDDREMYATLLRIVGGYRVTVAASGRAAIEALQGEPPDAVILDLALPGMDGFDVCEKIRGAPSLAYVGIIVISALDPLTEPETRLLQNARPNAVLLKPCLPDTRGECRRTTLRGDHAAAPLKQRIDFAIDGPDCCIC